MHRRLAPMSRPSRAALVAILTAFPLLGAPFQAASQTANQPQATTDNVCSTDSKRLNATDNPTDCANLYAEIGLPHRAGDSADRMTYACHSGYLVAHNNARKTPDWVIERLTRAGVAGRNTRPDVDFKPDTPPVACADSAIDKDYTNSGYARGHQAASADFNADTRLMADMFFFSNAVPQEGLGFNSGIWSYLEDRVRRAATARGEVIVITGPVRQPNATRTFPADYDACGTRVTLKALSTRMLCAGSPCASGGVDVPAALFKIIYDPRLGHLSAYLIENEDQRNNMAGATRDTFLDRHRVTVATLEALTGYRLLPGLPAGKRVGATEACGGPMYR